jgi:hypothetical protein
VITLTGHHYHNFKTPGKLQSDQYVLETLIKRLLTAKVILPNAERTGVEAVSTEELGISYPVLLNPGKRQPYKAINPNVSREGAMGVASPLTDPRAAGDAVDLLRFDFVVQFCWQPKTPTQRQEAREASQQQQPSEALQ